MIRETTEIQVLVMNEFHESESIQTHDAYFSYVTK